MIHRMTPDKRRRIEYGMALLSREPLGNGGIPHERYEYIALVGVEVADLRRGVR